MSVRSPNATKIGRGEYSTIVHQDGDLCVAEDNVGTIITENADDATVIQAAIDDLAEGTLFIAKGDYNIPSANINIVTGNHRIDIVGEGRGGQNVENGTRLVFSNNHGIYLTGTGWFNKICDIGLIGDGTGKAISNDSDPSNFNSYTFENIGIKNFDTGIELNKAVSVSFLDILILDTVKGFRLPGNSWSPYLKTVSTGYGAVSTEGIYIDWADRAYLENCDGGNSSTFTYSLRGYGITVLSPYSEAGSGPMRLAGSHIIVIGGRVRSNVHIGYNQDCYNADLKMVGAYNHNDISFTVDAGYDNSHILIDTGSWSPTVTDTLQRALVQNTLHDAEKKHYIRLSGAGHHYNDLLAIPTTSPLYTPIAGTMYFDTAAKELYVYDGAAWKSVTLT